MVADQDGAPERRQGPHPLRILRVRLSRVRILVVAGVGLALLLVALLPWEWSFIDDGGLLTALRVQQTAHGALAGVATDVGYMYRIDLGWGLFRPAFWVYCATFYLLPVGPAHAVRVAMVVIALAGPLAVLARTITGRTRTVVLVWAGAVLLANDSLFTGVWYPSLQELSGLAFVGLGLSCRRPWPRLLYWLVAAWFKAPFSWLLLAYGLLLCRRRETRRAGILGAALGAGTLVTATAFSRGGLYTAAISYSPTTIEHNTTGALGMLGGALLAIVAGLFALRPRLDLAADPTAPALLIGGAGYLGNLLVWHTDGYYASPYVYLISAGILLAARDPVPLGGVRLAAGLAVPVLVAGYFLAVAEHTGRQNIGTVIGLRDCVLRLPESSIVGYNRQEAWIRLDFIVREHSPVWTGRIALVQPDKTIGISRSGPVSRLDYFIYQPGYYPAAPSLTSGPVVCRTPGAAVYRVMS